LPAAGVEGASANETGLSQIGKEEPSTGREIIQPSSNPEKLDKMAEKAAPQYEDRLEAVTKGIPGVTYERVRDEKNPSRLKEKIEGEDQQHPPFQTTSQAKL